MRTALTRTALAASLALGLVANTSAAGFELVGAPMGEHYLVTLKLGSLVDLRALLGDGFDEGNENTSFDRELGEAGLTFVYSGSWSDAPLVPSHTQAPGGVSSLTETPASGKRFSLDFVYSAPARIADGSELVSFAVAAPPGAWGRLDLISVTLNPFTIDTGSLTAGQAPLASLTIASAVPEPSAYVLMALGLAGFGLARRTRQG